MTVKKYEIFEKHFMAQVEGNPFDVEFSAQDVYKRQGFTSGQLMVCLVINKKMTKMSYSTAGVQKNTNEFLPNQGEL